MDGEVRPHRPLEGHEVAHSKMCTHFAVGIAVEKSTARLDERRPETRSVAAGEHFVADIGVVVDMHAVAGRIAAAEARTALETGVDIAGMEAVVGDRGVVVVAAVEERTAFGPAAGHFRRRRLEEAEK